MESPSETRENESHNEQALPIPIQTFLWRQISPFVRPKLGKLHEASCMFCQSAPGHHELKEACKVLEKVLVQNIQIDLSPVLKNAIASIPRWRFIQAAFPHVMHCAATLLHNRKDTSMQTLGVAETKLLYILHWIILDALDECAEADKEEGVYRLDPYYYLHSIPTISLFIYLFAPLSHHIKESDLQTFRLENGRRLWKAMWEYRHPNASCFKALCKPRPRMLWDQSLQCGSTSTPPSSENTPARNTALAAPVAAAPPSPVPPDDMGVPGSVEAHFFLKWRFYCRIKKTKKLDILTLIPSAVKSTRPKGKTHPEESRSSHSEPTVADGFPPGHHPTPQPLPPQPPPTQPPKDDQGGWVSSPKDTVFPETIPEESSSTEEEHVVIFRLPSQSDSDMKDDSMFYQVTAISGLDTRQSRPKSVSPKTRPPEKEETKKEGKEGADSRSKMSKPGQATPAATDSPLQQTTVQAEPQKIDLGAATFLDVAVLRCLFIPQWQEEGVYWALQFLYHRLRDIADDVAHQQQPRRRSNSLPIPKIHVSLYQSPETKKRSGDSNADSESKEFISLLPDSKDVSFLTGESTGSGSESPYFRRKHSGDEGGSHFRRASEKVKRKMKMADLRAFVETKLLSKSEKTLEKIGRDDPKSLAEQCVMASECHCSLDAGDDHLSRPGSAQGGVEHSPTSNLVKGKSMPSLRYIGEITVDRNKRGRFPNIQSHSIPNPIITVTEHTPTPSPDFLHRQSRQGSIDSQLDLLCQQESGKQSQERKPSLARSHTDSNITYQGEELMEAPGSGPYITREGDIDYQVVLKAVHAAAMKDTPCCTLRVCEVILNLLELLIDLEVLKPPAPSLANGDSKSQPGNGPAGSLVGATGRAGSDHGSPTSEHDPMTKENGTEKLGSERYQGPHSLTLNCILRVIRHLGCPHGCADGQRGPPADFLRSQGQSILSQLQKSSPKQFHSFLRYFVRMSPLQEVLDLFHALVGFCVDPSSLLSPMNQKRSSSKSPDIAPQGAYSTNFGAGLNGVGRGVESHIMLAIFKPLVSRLVQCCKELKTPDNVNLMCDVRQFMTYVREAHGGVFRRVALSGLLDCATRPNRKERVPQTTRVIKHITHSELSEQPELMPGSCYVVDNQGSRKLLLKKRSTSSTCASLLETDLSDEGPTKSSQSPLGPLRRKHHVLTPRHSERNMGGIAEGLSAMGGFGMSPGMSPFGASREREKSDRFRIGGLVSWFRRENGRTESVDSQDAGSEDGALIRQASLHHSLSMGQKPPNVGERLMRARRRMEDHIKNLGFGKGKKKDGGMEDTQGTYLSRRNSVDLGDHNRESEFVVFKERKLVPMGPVRAGMGRLAFLLETCQPGSVPDSQLLAASLDLPHAPVVARAALLLECSYFVHCCNKGQWPSWMKQNLSLFRPSGPLPARGPQLPSGLRRTHSLQRSAGKMFFQWAEALGTRLEELLIGDKKRIPQMVSMVLEENRHKELLMEDEEEDFMDEASVNIYGSECPMALRMVACMLLMEITSFMRETFQTLPKICRASQRGDRPPPWERMYSREANRRWSMALSSMGHSQTSAQSMQSIAGDQNAGNQAERKISFVLHEPDNESEGSSKSISTMQGEEGGDRKLVTSPQAPPGSVPTIPPSAPPSHPLGPGPGTTSMAPPPTTPSAPPASSSGSGRPFLLRRGTTSSAVPSGSIKRRSLKLRRHTKEAKELAECEVAAAAAAQVKRTDSIQSKRKVSSLSDRSDTSEQGGAGEVSGEESPGILSDDQPPESPSDSNDTDDNTSHMPWLKVMIQLSNSFNFYCSHQQFCHPFCYRRHMRACTRLIKSVRKVYGEEFGVPGQPENDDKQREEAKKESNRRSRKVSDQTSTQASPIRRKDSDNKRDRLRDVEGSQTGRSATRDSSRDITLSDPDQDGGVSLAKKKNGSGEDKSKDQPPILKYLKTQVRDVFHAPLALLVKGAVVLTEEQFIELLPVAWELLLEHNQEVAATAASLFILAAVKAPNPTTEIMRRGLHHHDPAVRIKSILRFQVLWKLRYQVWPRMEEGAQVTFKVLPPGIEFTLPSPKIGIESLPVVDPPWSPQVTSKVEEVTISQESHRVLVSGTKTRKKQQTELVKQALAAQENKRRQERENFLITTIPVTVQAAYEPSLYHAVGDDHEETGVDEETDQTQARNTSHLIHSAHSLFPSCLCSAVIQITNLLDDAAVSPDGNAVYEVAYQVIWNCLVEDSALFLRFILERLTRDHQELMFKLLRHLIRFIPKLPQQAAFALYNYIIGYVMFYVRSPQEDGQRLIGTALSILWMVVHSVHGIMFKDLKQILRKEQCDASILLTANVPSAKKIIVHGPQELEAGMIPSQFTVQEDTQFCQILRESLDYCGIDENRREEYYLIDYKTHQIHNPSSYVRDFYFFKRSQYPELELVHMKPEDAFNALQHQQFLHKFVEIGKVLLTWAILKNVDMVVQRVVFLHEELMKLPSFPRKALEADLDLYKGGEIGRELLGLDVLHKFMWVRLIARMFEAMAGNFAYSGDIHLSLNVLNGAVILHSEDACILRYVMATYINAAYHFKNIFSTNGYLLIIPTLLQLYSSHQTNSLVTRTVEYTVKQFYLMNRKPFILQMFGSVSAILDTDEDGQYGDAHKVRASDLFNLLLSLETPSPDPLNIGELVKEEKPLKAIDFCYHDEDEMVNVLDCISLCVMVIAYAADSVRGHQMLIILDAILPCYLQQIQLPSYNKDGKTEKEIIQQLAVALRTMVSNCEALTKHYNGPQKESSEHKGSSQRNFRGGPYSPGYDFEEDSHGRYISDHARTKIYERDMEDSEVLRTEYRRPRDILLSMIAEFLTKCSARLAELNKKGGDGKPCELFDVEAHVRLGEVAYSLLKVSSYDPVTMACKGLQRYMVDVLPYAEWSNEQMRPTLLQLLRRLEKVFSKIHKKPSIRCHTNWDAAAGLLKGVYEAMFRYKFIVHMQHLKSLVNTCQALIIGDPMSVGLSDSSSQATTAVMSQVPPPQFCSTVVRLIALQIVAIGETYSLENVCGGTSVFPNPEKTEKMLINLLMPLCLRVGSGRTDVAPLRPADISFVLTVVLHAMSPPQTKSAPVTAQNIKSISDTRAGSLTGSHSDSKKQSGTKVSRGLYQVAFLALRILMVCFERELSPDWPRVAHTLRDLVRHNEAGPVFWNFIDFVVTQRTALFVLLRPFIYQKLAQPAPTDEERHTMFVVREKLRGFSLPLPKSRGTLLMELAQEMKKLKEDLEERRFDEQKEAPGKPPHHRHRPSIIELFTGSSHQFEPQRYVHRESVGSVASSIRGIKEDTSRDKKGSGGEQLSPSSPAEDSPSELNKPPRLQRSKAQSRKTFRLRKSKKNHKSDESKIDPQRQFSADAQLSPCDATDLPEASELVRLSRHMSVRTSRGPTETGLGLSRHHSPHHHHSTLALSSHHGHMHGTIFRQSRLGSIGERGLHASVDSRYPLGFHLRKSEACLAEDTRSPSPLLTPVPLALPPTATGTQPIPIPTMTDTSFTTTGNRGLIGAGRIAAGRPSAPVPCPGLVTTASTRSSAQESSSLGHSDLSFDEDSAVSVTSSTSGYRENCSLLMMPMEIPSDDTIKRSPRVGATGGSSTTVAADSPEHSSCGNTSTTPTGDGETTALLGPGYSDSHSQHSLLMVFERQDEDTLI